MYGAQCHIAWPNVLIQPSPAQKAQIKSIMDLLLLWILFLLPNQGDIYIFTIIRKVTRWISTLKWAPTDLALL